MFFCQCCLWNDKRYISSNTTATATVVTAPASDVWRLLKCASCDSCPITVWTCNFLSAMYRHSHCHQYISLSCVSRCHIYYCPVFTWMWLRYVWVFAVVISSVWRLSSVCNVGAPYSGSWTFRQNFFTAVYAGHPLTSVQNFTEIVLGEALRRER